MNIILIIIQALFIMMIFIGMLLTSGITVIHFEEKKYFLGIILFFVCLGITIALIYLITLLGLD